MNHPDNLVYQRRAWLSAGAMILMMAAVLGLASDQTLLLIARHFQFGERSIASSTKAMTSAAKPIVAHRGAPPVILTVPFATTRTRQIMEAGVKHRAEFARRVGNFRSRQRSALRLLVGLALVGTSRSPNR